MVPDMDTMARLIEGVKTMNSIIGSIGESLWRSANGPDTGKPE